MVQDGKAKPGQEGAPGLEHGMLWRCRQQGINWGHMVLRVVTLVPLLGPPSPGDGGI